MIRHIICLLCLSAISIISINAQKNKDIPSFGKVTNAELEMKDCEFDKNADAVVLFDMAESNCILNLYSAYNLVTYSTERHVRIKILKPAGTKQADIHIPYLLDGEEKIKNLTAQTYNLDGSGNIVISKVEKKLIYDKNINKRRAEIIFTFPEVKAGSVIEYKYTHDGAASGAFNFQRSIPVVLSKFIIDFPNELVVSATPYCTLPYNADKEQRTNRTIQRFTMTNVPALPDEPYMSCREDYLQRIEAKMVAVDFPGQPRKSLVSSWPTIVKNMMEDEYFGIQLKKDIPRTADLDALLKNVTDTFARMTIVHNYVRKNMAWNGIDGIGAFDGVKSAWKDKKGTTGEINLILVNLLKDAGIRCHPVLVSTRENGTVKTFNPSASQFDKVMAYVNIGDKFYVLDGTEKYTPSNLIPLDVMASEGMVIEKPDNYEWGWKVLWNESEMFTTMVLLNGSIDDKNVLSGDATVSLKDYARVVRMKDFKADKEKYIQTYFTSKNDGAKIEEFNSENEETDSLPLNHKFHFTQQLNASGDYVYFSTNLFSGLEQNPFLADTRFSDIIFSANQKYTIVGTFYIPENYTFDAVPKSLKMVMPDNTISFTRFIGADEANGQVSMRMVLEFKSPIYNVANYAEFQEFYKQLQNMLNEQVVIKKKS